MGKWKCLGLALVLGELLLGASEVRAGGKISIDETKWVSLGAGLRTSFGGTEDGAPNGHDWSTDFNINNARIYLGGQIHKYLKVEVNTECVFCDNGDLREFALLDAIAKLLDVAFIVPGTKFRYGIDGLIGLIPVVGDIITTAISLWLVREARALGAPWHVTARMLGNVALDGVVGLVPVAGDAFDVMFRANVRNVRLLRRWLEKQPLV